MAYQHFYSRVPAKMSLFNKTDGYDTFAHSDGLSFDLIQKELSVIFENKPAKADSLLIQNGTLPPLYCQFTTAEGLLIQGCMSFMKLDYTGERSAYLVHSLVMTEEERKMLLYNPDNASLNPAMFRRDISGFDMTSFDSHPDDNFPTLPYAPIPAKPIEALVKQYDLGMIKRFIYALLSVACGKTKTVYLSLPYDLEHFSEEALEFLTTLLQIMPYHVRSELSFVTYVSDQTKFGDFRIKCQPESAVPVPAQKGVTIRFGARDAIGISDEIIAKNADIVDFFFGLIANDAVRRDFLLFCDKTVKALPALEKASMANIADLVLLFRQCSGYFNEMTVLPDDNAVYEFVCTYEKYRAIISDEYRAEALKCLWRYPNTNTAIPKNTFSKISKIYPSEPAASRRNVMNVALELIHTDVMRDKLFAFISSNYEKEDPLEKSTIMQHLSRVYYGGFLQAKLAGFFIQNFDTEPDEIRDLVIEKFLLTIRTSEIQPLVLDFLENRYEMLSPEQKSRFYTTFFEMLPEGDSLSEKLIHIVDARIETEDDDFRRDFVEKFHAAIQSDNRRKKPRLLKTVCQTNGFCCQTVVSHIFTDRSGQKIFTEYAANLSELPLSDRTDSLLHAFSSASAISDGVFETLSGDFLTSYQTSAGKTDLFLLLDIDKRLADFAAGSAASGAGTFCEKLRTDAIRPAIAGAIPSAFLYKAHPDGLTVLRDYASANPYLAEAPLYDTVRTYFEISDAAVKPDHAAMMRGCEVFTDKTIRNGVADHLQAELLASHKLDGEQYDATRFLVSMLISYLKTDMPSATTPYQTLVSDEKSHLAGVGVKMNAEQELQSAEEKAISLLLSLGGEAYTASLSDPFRTLLFGEEAETAQILRSYLKKYDKKAKKYLTAALPASTAHGTPYEAIVEKIVSETKGASSGGLFAKLFGKK